MTGPKRSRHEIRSALIAALIAAFISAAAATAGTVYITSRDVKDGTIRMVDLTPKVRAAIRVTGPAGPAGPAGPSTPSVLHTATVHRTFGLGVSGVNDIQPGRPEQIASGIAYCPAGMVVIGGSASPHGLHLTVSDPFVGVTGQGWRADAVDIGEFAADQAQPPRLDVTAICTLGVYDGAR